MGYWVMTSSPITACVPMMPGASPRLTQRPAAKPQTTTVGTNSRRSPPTTAPTKVEAAMAALATRTDRTRRR